MAKVTLEMDFDFGGFGEMSDAEKFSAIEAVIESGAESTCSEITVKSIAVKEN